MIKEEALFLYGSNTTSSSLETLSPTPFQIKSHSLTMLGIPDVIFVANRFLRKEKKIQFSKPTDNRF